MNWIKKAFFDILKCIGIGSIIAIAFGIVTGLIAIIASGGDTTLTLDWIKRVVYIIGGLGLLLSGGAFAQRDGTRPLVYEEQWKTHFKALNIGFVFLIISLSVVVWGMMVHNLIDFGRIF